MNEYAEALRRKEERGPFVTMKQSATFDGDGELKAQSIHYAPERKPYEELKDGVLFARSTLKDAEGNVVQEWMKEKVEDRTRAKAWEAFGKALKDDLPPLPPIPSPDDAYAFDDVITSRPDLLSVYPVGDHHVGMLAWKHEVGRSYDLDIAEELLGKAMSHLVAASPPSDTALVAFLGDFMHYDSMAPLTPAHGNLLDADGRAAKMVRVGARTMRRAIETAAAKHPRVHVIIEFGNHDPYSTLWLMEMMSQLYADNPRITIDCSPGPYHYFRFGANLLATHHGDKSKAASDKLPQIMAADRPKDWGETKYRLWMTGHVHSRAAYDYQGCTVESFRILAPPDAYAHGLGYRGYRDMKGLVFDIEDGEVARNTVNPEMLARQR